MNRNTLYAQLFVDSLIAAGLNHVCLAPGSRNTPLVLAFANRKDNIHITSHLDERSMAFFALGLARASGEPVAIVCTSGSAAANFFPAIVEAHQSRIPLIVLTADRPPELRHSGANQTIDQVKMFGDYALWFVDTPLPEANPSEHLLRYVRTLAHRAFDTANGARKGVVHINMPFRPPLEPTDVAGDMQALPAQITIDRDEAPTKFLEDKREDDLIEGRNLKIKQAMDQFADMSADEYAEARQKYENLHLAFRDEEKWFQEFDGIQRGLIILGPNAWRVLERMRGFQITAHEMGLPIFSDATSGARFILSETIGGYDVFLPLNLPLLQNIDFIVRIGDVPTSKALNTFLDRQQPKHYYHITEDGVWADDSYRVTQTLTPRAWMMLMDYMMEQIDNVDPTLVAKNRYEWADKIEHLERETWAELRESVYKRDFEGSFVWELMLLIPIHSALIVGNSMPVRHLDFWGRPEARDLLVYANRGASGIDGNISTALGAGAAHKDRPLVLLIGDVTFYHDMNGLLAIQRCGVPIVIVLLNNNGGGIFRTLPVKDFEPSFTDYFITPHALDFSHVGPLYGLEHHRLTTRAEFREAFPQAIAAWREGRSTLLEIMTDSNVDVATRREILAEVQEKLTPPPALPT